MGCWGPQVTMSLEFFFTETVDSLQLTWLKNWIPELECQECDPQIFFIKHEKMCKKMGPYGRYKWNEIIPINGLAWGYFTLSRYILQWATTSYEPL